jgi:hypothetical protein
MRPRITTAATPTPTPAFAPLLNPLDVVDDVPEPVALADVEVPVLVPVLVAVLEREELEGEELDKVDDVVELVEVEAWRALDVMLKYWLVAASLIAPVKKI